MPVSKHRKKGQQKAVKRPGAARALVLPVWRLQKDAVMNKALEIIDAEPVVEDEFNKVTLLLELVLEATMVIDAAGSNFLPRIGSRAVVIDVFAEELDDTEDEPDIEEADELDEVEGEPEAIEAEGHERTALRRLAARTLGMFEKRGIVRFEEDQLFLALPIPQFAMKASK